MSNKTAWQTPRADRERLLSPNPKDWISTAQTNAVLMPQAQYDVHGRALSQLARQARSELYQAALDYTRSYRDVKSPVTNDLNATIFILAGHQPELFHPGVWLKNALLDQVAKQNNANSANAKAIAINLVVDTDLMKSKAIKVPGGTWARPRWEQITLDQGKSGVPWEERKVVDVEHLSTWPARMSDVSLPPAQEGCWREYWPRLTERARATKNLGTAISQSRHQFEAHWGWNTLEFPVSHMTQLPSVRWFLMHLLVSAERFRTIYNRSIEEYRTKYNINSHAHPAPLLEQNGEWCETPFWIWHVENPSRSQVWVKKSAGELVLSDRAHWEIKFPCETNRCIESAMESWREYEAKGYRIRTRALVTTMVARLMMSDLFVHGLGGAKYDEVTDHLIDQLFGVRAPSFAVVSGTLLWPEATRCQHIEDESALVQKIRATRFHPERFLDGNVDEQTKTLIGEKKNWIQIPRTFDNAIERHQAIERVNRSLQSAVTISREKFEAELTHSHETARCRSIIGSRELAFVLHSENNLRAFFDQ